MSSLVNDPALLIPGKYNIIAVGGRGEEAILLKDGEHFLITIWKPWDKPIWIPELQAHSFVGWYYMVHPDPIPLDDVSEWHERAAKVDIPLGVRGHPIGEHCRSSVSPRQVNARKPSG